MSLVHHNKQPFIMTEGLWGDCAQKGRSSSGSYSPLGIQRGWNKQHVSPALVAADTACGLDVLLGLQTRTPELASTVMEKPLHSAQATVL